jgi:hypothetical protein
MLLTMTPGLEMTASGRDGTLREQEFCQHIVMVA